MQIFTGTGLSLELVGMEALNRKLRAIGDAWEQAADDATREISQAVLEGAKARVPVVTGHLRDAGRVEPLAKHQYAVVFDKPYAKRIEFGFTGTDSLGRYYNQPPHPYLRPAYEEQRLQALEKTADLLERAMRSVA